VVSGVKSTLNDVGNQQFSISRFTKITPDSERSKKTATYVTTLSIVSQY